MPVQIDLKGYHERTRNKFYVFYPIRLAQLVEALCDGWERIEGIPERK